jgi:uncharacterized protein (DUF1499 family)
MITDFPLDFARFRRINKPNQFLALPANFTSAERPDATVGTFTATVDQVRDVWLQIVRAAPRVSGVRQLEGQIECIQRTPLVGWPDWITAMPVDLGNGQASMCVFSRSKYGLRDFGVNQTRGLDWLAQLASKLPPVA